MFGDNKMRAIERDPTSLAVQEVFYTLQGEGPYSGMPSVFVRLAGCNLACYWCDTEFESGIDNRLGIDALVEQIDKTGNWRPGQPRLIVLTGGEPLRQNVVELITRLLWQDRTFRVQIETAGTVWQDDFDRVLTDRRVTLVCSPKTNVVRAEIEQRCFHWKYVVAHDDASPEDGLPVKGTQRVNKDREPGLFRPLDRGDLNTIWVSPRDDYDQARNELNHRHAAELCLRYGYRLSLQTHKIVKLP